MSTVQRSRNVARRDFLRLVGQSFPVALFAAGLAGCGGGGSSQPGGGTPGPNPTPTPGGNGGPLTPETRAAAMQAINAQMTAWLQAGEITDQQAIDLLRSRSEFVEAGSVNPGTAWARFTDGRMFIVSYNFAESDPAKSRAERFLPEHRTRAVNKEIPGDSRARIYNALGSAFTPPHDEIRGWMGQHGYQLAPDQEATVDVLKTVGGDGVFYINTHGASCRTPDGTTLWAMWTADETSPAKDGQYADLLNDGSLVYFSAIHDKALIQNPFNDSIEGNLATHYAITKRFVDRFNWQFGANSMVFVNCCWSFDPEFGEACLKRKAGVYIGWTNAAKPSDAWRAALFLFDRFLGQLQGGNNFEPEAGGPQRAFNIPGVFSNLQARGWHLTNTAKSGPGELTFGPTKTEFGLLAPSIKYVETDEMAKKVILHGLFGTDPGRGTGYVRIEGTDLPITRWEVERIEADILPDQHGDIWVQIANRKSNIRQLTRWDGVMDYEATGPQSLRQNMKINFRIRADVGKFREEPAGALKDRELDFYCVAGASATKAHIAYSGSAELMGADGQHSCYTQWTGTGDVISSSEPGVDTIVLRGKIDTGARSLRMEVIPLKFDLFQYRQYVKFRGNILGGYSDQLNPIAVTIAEELFDATDNSYGVPQRFLVSGFNGQWVLSPEERRVDAKPPTPLPIGMLDGEIKKIPTSIRWSAVNPVKPPRETESRKH